MSIIDSLFVKSFKNQVRFIYFDDENIFMQKCEAKIGRSGAWLKGKIVLNHNYEMLWKPNGETNVKLIIGTLQPQYVKSRPWLYAEIMNGKSSQILIRFPNKYFMLKFAYNVKHFTRHIIFK